MWTPEEYYGGAARFAFPAGAVLCLGAQPKARVWFCTSDNPTRTVSLPDATRLRTGAGLYLIINNPASGAGNLVHIVSYILGAGSIEVMTALNPGERALLSLEDNSTQVGVWRGRMSTG